MARPRKVEAQDVVFVEASEPVEVQEVQEVAKSKVDVRALRAVLFNTKLEVMQETAVKAVQSGDELTMKALEAVLSASNSGIASQYIQQIIQRNS